MIDDQRRRSLDDARNRIESHLLPVGAGHEEVLQRGRSRAELRLHFQHHPILIGLREDRGYQALAKRVVQGVVDGRRGDAQAARRGAIDFHVGFQSLVLQVTGHVGQLRQLVQPRHQLRNPHIQFGWVGILQRELILSPAHPVLDGEILDRLHVQGDPRHAGQPALQAADDLATR